MQVVSTRPSSTSRRVLTERLRDKTIGGGLSGRSAAEEEVHLRSTRAVADTDGASKRDEVTRSDVVLCDERILELGDLVQTDVRVESSLDLVKDDDGTVGTSATTIASQCLLRSPELRSTYPNLH